MKPKLFDWCQSSFPYMMQQRWTEIHLPQIPFIIILTMQTNVSQYHSSAVQQEIHR